MQLNDIPNIHEAILEAMPDLIFVLSSSGEHISFYSNFDGELLVPPENIIGKTVDELLPKDVAQKYMDNIEKTLKNNELNKFEYELLFDNETRFFEARLKKLNADNVIAIVRNISDSKRLQNQLIKAQKMEVIGKTTSGIAHDFQNVLTILNGNFFMLSRTVPKAGKKYLDICKSSIENAIELTNSLLHFASNKKEDIEVIDLGSVLCQMDDIIHDNPLFKKSKIKIDCDDQEYSILSSKTNIENNIFNLLLNAKDATADIKGAEIIVTLTKTTHENINYVKLSVKDNGCGIDEDIIEKVTAPLFTTKPEGEGTGLGLSMIKKDLEACDGLLKIDSSSEGTEVTLFYPEQK